MIHNVNYLMVDINGELFPAVNICVPDCYPEYESMPDFDDHYGVYFEIMFENGHNATVYQEVTNRCGNRLDHFIVEITHLRHNYKYLLFAFHCKNEEDLVRVLRRQIEANKDRDRIAYGDMLEYI